MVPLSPSALCIRSLLRLSNGNPRGEGDEAERSCALQVTCQSLAAARSGRGMFWAGLGSTAPLPPPSNSALVQQQYPVSPCEHRRLEAAPLGHRGSCGQQGAPAPAQGEALPCPAPAGEKPCPALPRPVPVPAAPVWARPGLSHSHPPRAATSLPDALLKYRWSRGRGKPSGCVRRCQGLPRRAVGILSRNLFQTGCRDPFPQSFPAPAGPSPGQPDLT